MSACYSTSSTPVDYVENQTYTISSSDTINDNVTRSNSYFIGGQYNNTFSTFTIEDEYGQHFVYVTSSIPKAQKDVENTFDRLDEILSTRTGWCDSCIKLNPQIMPIIPKQKRQLLCSISGWLAPIGKKQRRGY